MKLKLIKVGIPVFMLFTFLCCSSQKTDWQGSIEVVDGVTVVKNPKEPMYGEDVFSLEEELSIGDVEGPEEYMFSRMRSVAVDDEERIYILDTTEAHVKVFDQNGKPVPRRYRYSDRSWCTPRPGSRGQSPCWRLSVPA